MQYIPTAWPGFAFRLIFIREIGNDRIDRDDAREPDQFAPRDKDLKGADWFNVTEFPEMTFIGTNFVKRAITRDGHWKSDPPWRDQAGYAQHCCKKSRLKPARQD